METSCSPNCPWFQRRTSGYSTLTTCKFMGPKINALADTLNDEATKPEATGLLRDLIIEVRMTSETAALNSHIINLQ